MAVCSLCVDEPCSVWCLQLNTQPQQHRLPPVARDLGGRLPSDEGWHLSILGKLQEQAPPTTIISINVVLSLTPSLWKQKWHYIFANFCKLRFVTHIRFLLTIVLTAQIHEIWFYIIIYHIHIIFIYGPESDKAKIKNKAKKMFCKATSVWTYRNSCNLDVSRSTLVTVLLWREPIMEEIQTWWITAMLRVPQLGLYVVQGYCVGHVLQHMCGQAVL